MAADPHGYVRLHRSLLFIAGECKEAGATDLEARIGTAAAYFGGGSPTEFLGEASLALREVINDPISIPPSVRKFAEALDDELREGFARVGGA